MPPHSGCAWFGAGHVVAFAVDPEDLLLRRLSLEVREVRRARLVGPRAQRRHVDGAPEGDAEGLRGGLGRHVLPQVAVGAFTLDHQRLDSEHLVAPSERRRRIVDDLPFRNGLRAGRQSRRREKGEPYGFHKELLFDL